MAASVPIRCCHSATRPLSRGDGAWRSIRGSFGFGSGASRKPREQSFEREASLRAVLVWGALVLIIASPARAGELTELGPVAFKGEIFKSKNLSGLGVAGDPLVLGADEGYRVQVLRRDGDRSRLVGDVVLGEGGKEVDIEGIACAGNTVYMMGWHSGRRAKVDEANTYEKNRELIATRDAGSSRDRVFPFTLDHQGQATGVEATSYAPSSTATRSSRIFRDVSSSV